MLGWFTRSAFGFATAVAAGVVVAIGALWLVEGRTEGQGRTSGEPRTSGGSTYRAPRSADGKPDLNGVWQAVNTANWNLEDHPARSGPVVSMGALGAIPAGIGVVVGGEIPYHPAALAQRNENAENWLLRDPVVKCYFPGVPRVTYMPFPFQIVQSADHVLLAYEFANTSRTIYVNGKDESPIDTWMGWSNGRWEGETLVVTVTNFNDQTWFDSAGNFHSEALKVTERYTRTGPDHLLYEATMEDPKTFTRPWTIRMPLYRRVEPNVQLLEFKCVEFVEELIYGHLRKRSN